MPRLLARRLLNNIASNAEWHARRWLLLITPIPLLHKYSAASHATADYFHAARLFYAAVCHQMLLFFAA